MDNPLRGHETGPRRWPGVTSFRRTRACFDLRSVSDDLAANQKQIEQLQTQISQLNTLGADSAVEIARLRALVDEHQTRVDDLSDRYLKTLTLAQRLKREAELAAVALLGAIAALKHDLGLLSDKNAAMLTLIDASMEDATAPDP